MTLQEMLLGGGGALLVLTTLIQISPLKIDPWGAFARWIGRALNGDVLKKLDTLEHSQQETNISTLTMSGTLMRIGSVFYGSILN